MPPLGCHLSLMHSKHDEGKSRDDNQCDLVMNDDGVALGESSLFKYEYFVYGS